jgi:hypothetical protein
MNMLVFGIPLGGCIPWLVENKMHYFDLRLIPEVWMCFGKRFAHVVGVIATRKVIKTIWVVIDHSYFPWARGGVSLDKIVSIALNAVKSLETAMDCCTVKKRVE